MADAIGMMDAGYFVGRKEIMDWINEALLLNLDKVEQTANGAIACQLLDIIFPGQVPMHKLNWGARADYEYIGNYKVLQGCFDKLGIDRRIEVDKLVRAKYQDNLEFMQWFKRFYEMHTPTSDYDAVAARGRGRGGQQYTQRYGSGGAVSRPPRRSTPPSSAGGRSRPASSSSSVGERTEKENRGNAAPRSGGAAPKPKVGRPPASPTPAPEDNVPDTNDRVAELEAELDDARRDMSEMVLNLDGLTRERDFYFDKLKEIEVLIQAFNPEDDALALTRQITDVLYATAEGFEPEIEEGEVPDPIDAETY